MTDQLKSKFPDIRLRNLEFAAVIRRDVHFQQSYPQLAWIGRDAFKGIWALVLRCDTDPDNGDDG